MGGGAGSPKALVECARGRFVLKRRAPGRDNPFRVAFSHEVMLHLRARGYPAPILIGTRDENNSLAQVEGRVYELFVYVEGAPFARTAGEALDAGRQLAALHVALAPFAPRFGGPPAQRPAPTIVREGIAKLGDPPAAGRLDEIVANAERRLEELGALDGPHGLLHGDWHPGNLLFRDDRVAGVFDFDGVHPGALVADLAQGVTQFSMLRRDPGADTDEPDLPTLGRFWQGYREGGGPADPGPDAAGALVARSLAVEWAQSAAAGVLGPMPRVFDLLEMVVRKARWALEHADAIARAARAG
ncbi:MAG: phosphotransferase [Phycisphaerales bacterium]